jgi:hypothetical protein
MSPEQFKIAGIRLFGRKHWKSKLADALAVDVSTIHRLGARKEIPGPYEIAVRGMIENKRRQEETEREARKLGLVPRKRRKKVLKARRPVPYAGKPKKEKRREENSAGDRADLVELDLAGPSGRLPDAG